MQTVLITGASSGFGLQAARTFLDRGWQVVATMREPDTSLFEPVDRLLVTALDVTDAESIEAARDRAIDRFGGVDVVVNNAGVGMFSAFEVTPESEGRELFETNFFGALAVCRAWIPHMRQRGAGTLINVTSSLAIAPKPFASLYVASKAALEGFTESLAFELDAVGLRARLVEPGAARTTKFQARILPRAHALRSEHYAEYTDQVLATVRGTTRQTTEADVAEAIFAAATYEGRKLRFLAGADTKHYAALRWGDSEAAFQDSMWSEFGAR